MPLCIPTEADAELLAPSEVDRVLLADRPIQLALERVEDEIDLVEQQDTLLEELEDLGAVINVLGVDGELRHDGLLTETLGDSRQKHTRRLDRLPATRLAPFQTPHHLDKFEHETFDRSRRGTNDGLRITSLYQLHVQVSCDWGST